MAKNTQLKEYIPEKKLSVKIGKVNCVHIDAVELCKTKQCLSVGEQCATQVIVK